MAQSVRAKRYNLRAREVNFKCVKASAGSAKDAHTQPAHVMPHREHSESIQGAQRHCACSLTIQHFRISLTDMQSAESPGYQLDVKHF